MNKKKNLIKRLDDLWSKLIKLRDQRCIKCNSRKKLSAHHIFSRAKFSTRWDPLNGVTLCNEHHTGSSEFSAHLTQEKFREWIKKEMGPEEYEALRKKSLEHSHWAEHEMVELIKMFNNKLKELVS